MHLPPCAAATTQLVHMCPAVLQVFELLAQLVQLPSAAVEVCSHLTATDIVLATNEQTLATQPLCRALHKLQPMGQSMEADSSWSNPMQEEAAGR